MKISLTDELLLAMLNEADYSKVKDWRFDLDSLYFELKVSDLLTFPLTAGHTVINFNSSHFIPNLEKVKLVEGTHRVIAHEPIFCLIEAKFIPRYYEVLLEMDRCSGKRISLNGRVPLSGNSKIACVELVSALIAAKVESVVLLDYGMRHPIGNLFKDDNDCWFLNTTPSCIGFRVWDWLVDHNQEIKIETFDFALVSPSKSGQISVWGLQKDSGSTIHPIYGCETEGNATINLKDKRKKMVNSIVKENARDLINRPEAKRLNLMVNIDESKIEHNEKSNPEDIIEYDANGREDLYESEIHAFLRHRENFRR